MQLFTNHREAFFLERPNRFVILARAAGGSRSGSRSGSPSRPEILQAHCPNPGRMLELLVPGRRLILQRRDPGRGTAGRGSRLDYTLAAAYYQGTVVPLQSTQANALAEELILPSLFPGLQELEREVRVGSSRLDFRFLLPGDPRPMHLEVKSCTLVEEGTAMFPDAATARGLRHLEELAALGEASAQAGVLFVVQNPSAERFLPDVHTDIAFSRRLLELRGRIWIGAASIRSGPDGVAALERLHLPLDFEAAARCSGDRGAYLLLLRLESALRCPVGSLGPVSFRAGHYVYVGSAMGGLTARLARHLRKAKSLRWHIDYLLAHVPRKNIRALAIRTPHRLECPLAREVTALAAGSVPRFGSSDCACPSHLYYFPDSPLRSEGFLRVLLRFRHDLALRP